MTSLFAAQGCSYSDRTELVLSITRFYPCLTQVDSDLA